MKKSVRRSVQSVVSGLFLAAACGSASAQTLVWSPAAPGAAWDATSQHWLDGSTPTAWIPGADAVFPAAASRTFIEVSGDIAAASVTFGNGADAVTVAGQGRLSLAAVTSAANATNSVATEILAPSGLAVLGDGAVALGRVGGTVTVGGGTLLAAASELASAIINVAPGATLATAGVPDPAANLIQNASFETPPMTAGTWSYISGTAGAMDAWGGTPTDRIGRAHPTAADSTWISGGSVPDGGHALIIQRNGTATQAFDVATAGLHQLSFQHFRRRGSPAHVLTLDVDGLRLPALLNINDQFDAARYASVPFWLEAGRHVLSLSGADSGDKWRDASSIVDLVVVAPPSPGGQPCAALGAESSVSLADGAAAVLNHAGDVPLAFLDAAPGATVTGAGTWSTLPGVYATDGHAWLPGAPADDISALLAFSGDAAIPTAFARSLLITAPATLSGGGITVSNLNNTAAAVPRVLNHAPATLNVPLNVPVMPSSTVNPTLNETAVFPPSLRLHTLAPLTLTDVSTHRSAHIVKTGPDTVSFGTELLLWPNESARGVGAITVYEGEASLSALNSGTSATNKTLYVHSLPQRPAAISIRGPSTFWGNIFLCGDGFPALNVLADTTNHSSVAVNADTITLHVAAGVTFHSGYVHHYRNAAADAAENVLKTGGGTLEILYTSTATSEWRGYLGQTVIRDGTVRLLTNDGTSADAGVLGRSATHAPVLLGDSQTATTPTLAFAQNASTFSHPVTVNAPAAIALEDLPAVAFQYPVTLNAPLAVNVPAGATATFGTLSAPTPQTLTLSGGGTVSLDDAPGVILSTAGQALILSPGAAAPIAVHALSADRTTLTFEFATANDSINASSSLTLSNLTFTLVYAGTTVPFAEPGTYTLATAPVLNADPAAFTVAATDNAYTYTFAATGNALTLTIASAPGTSAHIWDNPGSGLFATAANWEAKAVPDPLADALLGRAITADATVTLAAPAVLNSLRFAHPEHRYTLAGTPAAPLTLGALTLDAGGHTVSATLQPSGSAPLAITVNPGATLTFTDATLAGGLAADAPATLAGAPALTLTGTGFNATYANALSGAGTLALDAPGATQTLAHRAAVLQTPLTVTAGTLTLDATHLSAPAAVGPSGTLAATAPTNGLTAFWHLGNHTNSTLSRAALEAAAAGTPARMEILSGNSTGMFTHDDLTTVAPRATDWLLILRGSIDIPESHDDYVLHLDADDSTFLAIDDRDIVLKSPTSANNAYFIGSLSAGRHDILIGHSQGTGGAHFRPYLSRMFTPRTAIPAAWLTPLSTVSTVTGDGTLTLGANLRTTHGGAGYPQTGSPGSTLALNTSTSRPALTGGGTYAKNSGLDFLTLASAAPAGFSGLFLNGAGNTTLAAPGILTPAARLALYANTALTLTADQPAAALTGAGGLAIGTAPATITRITSDDDCGISTDKTYTHAIDFGTHTPRVTDLNGVPFLSTSATSGTCTGTDGASYGFSDIPPTGHGGNGFTAIADTGSKLHHLLYGMNYAHRNAAFELNGLNPHKTYELRIYQRAYSVNNTRQVILGFITNDDGRIDHHFYYSADATNTAYYVAYRYRPSPAGKLRVRSTPIAEANSLHLYALTNEEVPDTTAIPTSATTLTLTGAPAIPDHSGAITGTGTLTLAGPGAQAFSGPNTLPGGLTVTGGNAHLRAGARLSGPARIHAPGALRVSGAADTGGLTGNGALHLTAAPRLVFLSDDASTGISTAKAYTHLLDLGSRTAAPTVTTINGVLFTKVSAAAGGAGLTPAPALTSHTGGDFNNDSRLGPVTAGSGLYHLLYDMLYISNGAAEGITRSTTLTLSGLTAGRPYELRIYNRSWSWNNTRQQLIDFCCTADGAFRDSFFFNPDALAPNALVYRYVPEGTTLTIRVINATINNGWHIYGITNEDLSSPAATPAADGLAVTVPAERADVFSGTLSGTAPLVKRGGGSLLFSGASTLNAPVTVEEGALGADFAASPAPLTTADITFAPGTACLYTWNGGGSGTLSARAVHLPPAGFTILAGDAGHPPARRPVIHSADVPLATDISDILLLGFSRAVRAEYSPDRHTLYITSRNGTIVILW